MKITTIFVCLLLVVFMIVSCSKEQPTAPQVNNEEASLAKKSVNTGGLEEGTVLQLLADMNVQIEGLGESVRVDMAEWVTDPASGEFGQTVFANNRGNKQLGSHWVPGDPRRTGDTNIYYYTDSGDITGDVPAGADLAAIDRAMDTWNGVGCSNIPIVDGGDIPHAAFDAGYVQWLLGHGGVPGFLFDITHAGWLPGSFFDALAPGGSGFILGVTFTFIWTDGGEPTDIDNNGKADVAFREIYYNDAFSWADDGVSHFDIETVAFHEAGHGLSQGHFGKIFRTESNGKVHFSPQAVMNASYSAVQRNPLGTDNGGHCSIWGSWPNN